MISAAENAARSIPVDCFRLPQRYRPTIADIPAKIEAGVVLPAPDQDFPIIAYYLDGSPVSQERFMPTALAPFFEKGILKPAPEFPIVAYQLDGSHFYQGVDENNHVWWGKQPMWEVKNHLRHSLLHKKRRRIERKRRRHSRCYMKGTKRGILRLVFWGAVWEIWLLCLVSPSHHIL